MIRTVIAATQQPTTTTTLQLDPESKVIRDSHEGIEFSPESVWQMLLRQMRNSYPYQGGLAVVAPTGEGRVIISRTTLGYLAAQFAPHYSI